MIDIKLTTELKDLKRLSKEFPDISLQVRLSKVLEAIQLLERHIKKHTPEGAGPIHLRDTIHGKAQTYGRAVRGILGTPAQYGEALEYGSRPHFPPVGPLTHWVEKKLGYSGREAESIAWAIARTIARKGTEGAHMFEEGFDEAEAEVLRILNGIPEEIVRRIKN